VSAFDLGPIASSYNHIITHTTLRILEGAHEEYATHLAHVKGVKQANGDT